MNYKYIGFSKKVIQSENNLFNSSFYFKKASEDIKSFGSNGLYTKLSNYWNEFTKNISKSGHMDQLNFTVKSLNKLKRKITILDIGGGYGDNYFKFRRFNQSKLKKIEYIILEQNKSLISLGKNFFSKGDKVFFFDKLPKKKISILVMIGTIQYLENFFDILSKVNFESHSYIYFSRSIFSSFLSDYFSVQKISSHEVVEQSIKIHSLDLFEEKMKNKNFNIVFKRKNEYLNKYFKNLKTKKNINYFDILFLRKK